MFYVSLLVSSIWLSVEVSLFHILGSFYILLVLLVQAALLFC